MTAVESAYVEMCALLYPLRREGEDELACLRRVSRELQNATPGLMWEPKPGAIEISPRGSQDFGERVLIVRDE